MAYYYRITVHTYIYVYTHACMYVCVYVCMYVCMYVDSILVMYMCTYMHIHINTYINKHIHIHVHTIHILYTHCSLQHAHSEMGRCRAWIRLAVNECALENYIGVLCQDNTLLKYVCVCIF